MLVRMLVRLAAPRTKVMVGVQGLTAADRDEVDDALAHVLLKAERVTSPLVDAYEVNSRGAIELLARNGVDRGRLHYVPNGIDQDAWPFRPREAPGDPPVVLSVSRFATRKRQRDLVLAAADLQRRGVAFRLTLAGDGPTLPEITALVGEHGLADVVAFPGPVDAGGVRALLTEADVFCQPSLWEGMPTSVLEAMAAGVPVVGTAVNGIEDLVTPGETGWLVPAERPDRLADALEEAITAPHELRRRYAGTARARVEEEFTADAVVAARQELYEQVTRGRA
jgi:glycosyltransferase involved in cell wall biosynthesis